MPLFDYMCPWRHMTESIQPSTVRNIRCSRCGGDAERQISRRFGIVGPTTDLRNMFRRFNEASAEMNYAADTYEQRTGVAAPEQNLWERSLATANAMIDAGEAPTIHKEI